MVNKTKGTTKARIILYNEDGFDKTHDFELGEIVTYIGLEEEIKGDNGEQYYVFLNDNNLEQIISEDEFEWIEDDKWDEEK